MFIHPHQFPDITYNTFKGIGDEKMRQMIAERNRLTDTDTYNRTMSHTRGKNGKVREVFTATARRSPNNEFIVIDGIGKAVAGLLAEPITQNEVDFARDFYIDQGNRGGNNKFDEPLWQGVIAKYDGRMPMIVDGVKDGTVLKPGEPYLRVDATIGELGAHFEPALLRVFYKSAVATDARKIEEILGSEDRVVRVTDFGKRSGVNEEANMDAIASLHVGMGLTVTSNDAAAAVYPYLVTGGTIAHRYLASYSVENDALEEAINKNNRIALLVDLVDSYQGIDRSIALKKQYRHDSNKIIFMRLDSGDLKDQAVYALKQQKAAFEGLDPNRDKIVVADISSIDEIREMEKYVREAGFNPKDFIVYGLGGLLVARNKTRDALSMAYKLVWNATVGHTGKRSDNAVKRPIPGRPNIEVVVDGINITRRVVQEDESMAPYSQRLLETLYDPSRGIIPTHTTHMQAIEARARLLETRPWITDGPVLLSPLTVRISEEVQRRLKNM